MTLLIDTYDMSEFEKNEKFYDFNVCSDFNKMDELLSSDKSYISIAYYVKEDRGLCILSKIITALTNKDNSTPNIISSDEKVLALINIDFYHNCSKELDAKRVIEDEMVGKLEQATCVLDTDQEPNTDAIPMDDVVVSETLALLKTKKKGK